MSMDDPRRRHAREDRGSDTVIGGLVVGSGRVAYVGGSPTNPQAVVLLDLARGERRGESGVLAGGRSVLDIGPGADLFPTTDGDVAHAIYYPPTNPEVAGPADERPPLVVMSHGGPTSRSPASLDLSKQVFTSRDSGVVDVNYRGSSGYGREYMRKLDAKWGIYDVDDCIAAARFTGSAWRHR